MTLTKRMIRFARKKKKYVSKHKPVEARVISNIAKPWYGREALTISIGRDHV
jgi:hypothetical protein